MINKSTLMVSILRYFLIILFLLITFIGGAALYILHHHVINVSVLANYDPGKPSILLDDQGKEWARFQLDKREPIPLALVPLNLRNAFIAAEDWQFFSHAGISLKGIIRSTIINLWNRRKIQGASTITQQLVKLLFFDSRKKFSRKIKEQIYSILIERQFTKEQILETYLNHVYFGCGIYGVQAASQRFWGKDTSQLTLAECATLAAIIRSPAQYCPVLYPLSAQKRRNVVLGSMYKLGFISKQEYDESIVLPLAVKELDKTLFAPHAKELIRINLEELVGKQLLYTGGLMIQTTLNTAMQTLAQESFNNQILELKKSIAQEVDGGLLSIERKTGSIKALVGGFDFAQSKFNRAWQAKRQMGSVFKPLVYAAAIQAGLSFADTQIDEPITVEHYNSLWQPQNYNHRFDGQMTLAHALFRSNNIVTVKTLLKIGAHPIAQLAKDCHIQENVQPYPSLALGCVDANLKEVTGMFNLFANQGTYVEPHLVEWVKDAWGTKIYKHTIKEEKIMLSDVCSKVAKVLEIGIKRWRVAYKQEIIQEDVISKTGTTNDCRTCWFAGATPDFTTVVYVGCDDNRSMGDVYPIKTAFPIWLGLHSKLPPSGKHFTYDGRLKLRCINQWNGLAAYADDPDAIEIFV